MAGLAIWRRLWGRRCSHASVSIVILGWGSLTYDWHGLSLDEPVKWRLKGPTLPIEFSRKSTKGAREGLLTAVVDEVAGERVPTRLSKARSKRSPQSGRNYESVSEPDRVGSARLIAPESWTAPAPSASR